MPTAKKKVEPRPGKVGLKVPMKDWAFQPRPQLQRLCDGRRIRNMDRRTVRGPVDCGGCQCPGRGLVPKPSADLHILSA
jgi:hypothetical protein